MTATVAVVGFRPAKDAYPNAYHRIDQLLEVLGVEVVDLTIPLPAPRGVWGRSRSTHLRSISKFLSLHPAALYSLWRERGCRVAYLPYPGLLLAWLLSWLPRSIGPALVLDAFISWYDTAVNDRRLLPAGSLRARLLFTLERRAYRACDRIIVDTEANRTWLTAEFDLPPQQVRVLPLLIEEERFRRIGHPPRTTPISVVFVGTLVPLHGIEVIVEAAERLGGRPDIRFVVVGDGQESAFLEKNRPPNVTWVRRWHSSSELADILSAAEICLGVFGTTGKTDRVWPLKNYLYLAAGRPVITGDTVEARRLADRSSDRAFVTVPCGSPVALARAIDELADHPDERLHLGSAARRLYDDQLSRVVSSQRLELLVRQLVGKATETEDRRSDQVYTPPRANPEISFSPEDDDGGSSS